MKKNIFIIAFVLVIVFCFSACTSSEQKAESNAEITQITEWPENEYTAAIPVPETGVPVNQIENEKIFSVSLDDVSRQNCYDYLELLEENGFSKVAGDENDSSGGWLYTNGKVNVSVAQSSNGMTVGISFEEL